MTELSTVGPPLARPKLDRSLLFGYALAVVCFLVLGVSTPDGFAPDRLLGILGSNAALGIVAIGQTLVLLCRGLDMSVGFTMNLAAVVLSATMAGQDANTPAALGLALAAGALVGLVNGLIVVWLRLPPLLATLAVGTAVQGGYYVLTKGQPKGAIAPGFREFADGGAFGGTLRWGFLVWLAVWLLAAVLLYRTVPGRRFIVVGANPRLAFLAGVGVRRHTVAAYVASGLTAAIGGVYLTAFAGSASLTAGASYTLASVAAAVIGGVALTGGIGSPTGTFAGVLVLVFLQTILTTWDVPAPVQQATQGAVLIVMMLVTLRFVRRGRSDR
ncbi:ABC transporter permease [Actinophytocola gossypii]|uniref:Autoinducer 2 import system permease protein LsrD n=1 Tax=Actinophytocola gossypii TaxID=2812003 RepID=A0ABT2J468_9PSEU|nr:ABC transporter permease [Actinophytocola gossypii]MCT2582295.1 ABC transporter permease [Actinophytocola gossypii]